MSKNKTLPAPLPDLVFLHQMGAKAEPYTTSDIIAEYTGHSYRSIQRTIDNQMARLERFGRVRFQFTPFETKGGVQRHKVYHLNEEQATLLITFLKNTPVVADFKVELVRQFYTIRQELTRRKELRTEGKPIRRSLTDALRDSGEVVRMKGHAYAAYTNLAYKLTTGKSARQLRKERGAGPKTVAADFLTSEELERYQKHESAIAALLDIGLDYPRIRVALAGGEE